MKPLYVVVLLAAALGAAGCAGGPGPSSTEPLTVELLSSREVSFLTPTRANNPYLPISGLIQGNKDEFAVVRVRLSLGDAEQVTMDGTVRDETGTAVAELQTYDQMVTYWDIAEDLPERDVQVRSDALRRYYPQGFSFTAKKGRSEYIVVFKGKNPMPRPATVALTVTLGDAEPQEFTFPLPPKVKDLLGR